MPDEAQNSIPTENSIPPSPQEPILDAPIPPSTSEPAPMSPETPEAPMEAESVVPVNIDNSEIITPEAQNSALNQTAQTDYSSSNKSISEATTQPTAQMAGNEPLAEPESKSQIPEETYKNHTRENLTK